MIIGMRMKVVLARAGSPLAILLVLVTQGHFRQFLMVMDMRLKTFILTEKKRSLSVYSVQLIMRRFGMLV